MSKMLNKISRLSGVDTPQCRPVGYAAGKDLPQYAREKNKLYHHTFDGSAASSTSGSAEAAEAAFSVPPTAATLAG